MLATVWALALLTTGYILFMILIYLPSNQELRIIKIQTKRNIAMINQLEVKASALNNTTNHLQRKTSQLDKINNALQQKVSKLENKISNLQNKMVLKNTCELLPMRFLTKVEQDKNGLNLLVSFPRSGNTFLRLLLQRVTQMLLPSQEQD